MSALDFRTGGAYIANKKDMPRTSPVYYIAPSAISITPNANGSANDLAVYVAKGAKIKVFSMGIPQLDIADTTWQEWTIAGRNRRLNNPAVPYTIYARLKKSDKTKGYLIFAPKEEDGAGWKDKYAYVTMKGLATDTANRNDQDYWYFKLGDVSAPDGNERTADLDTGILGTDQFNTEWDLNPDKLPLRVEFSCTIDDNEVGQNPYVNWDKSAILQASLVKGWNTDSNFLVHHWTIVRNTGNDSDDAEWSYPDIVSDSSSSDSSSSLSEPDPINARQMPSGQIALSHSRTGDDDFSGAVAAVFTVTAWGEDTSSDSSSSSSDSDSSSSTAASNASRNNDGGIIIPLAKGIITIFAETVEADTPISCFRWYKGDVTPKKPTDTTSDNPLAAGDDPAGAGSAFPADRWSSTIPDQPGTDSDSSSSDSSSSSSSSDGEDNDWILWMCSSVRHGNGTRDAWSGPVRISGKDGDPGADAKEREWIYVGKDQPTTFGSQSREPHPKDITEGTSGGQAVSGNDRYTTDDFVPTGWNDNAIATDQTTNRYVYASWREWNKTTERWGDFSDPILWSNWGRQGIDGDGVQYVYKLYATQLTDAECSNFYPTKPNEQNANGEWLPAGRNSNDANTVKSWTDDAEQTSSEYPYCYCSVIKRINGTWGNYEKLSLWAKWSEDGQSVPSYIETQEAWSNEATTASPTTMPSDCQESDWSVNTPTNTYSRAYLWRRSRTRTWNPTTKVYDGANGEWTYTRLSGTNGTSINTKGTVAAVIDASGSFSTSGFSNNDLGIKQGQAQLYKFSGSQSQWNQNGPTASDGDSYTVTKDCTVNLDGSGSVNVKGHMLMWSAEASKWIDLGQFKGDSGTTYYTHIAWAYGITLGTQSARKAGQTNTPNAIACTAFSISPAAGYNWMGILIDTDSFESTDWRFYTWTNTQGPAGDDAHEINPNILLRTTFPSISNMQEKWQGNFSHLNGNFTPTPDNELIQGRNIIRSEQSSAEAADIYQDVSLEANTWYTFSFWLRQGTTAALGNTTPQLKLYMSYSDSLNGCISEGTLDGAVNIDSSDGYALISNTAWSPARHVITFKTVSSMSGVNGGCIRFRFYGGINVISMPKLEVGKFATAYVANEDDLKGADGTGGENAVLYEIVPSIESVRVSSNAASVTLSTTPNAKFYKIDGSSRSLHSLYWALKWKSGTSYTAVTPNGSGEPANQINLPTTYSKTYDALVIFIYSSSSTSTTTFLAKKEIYINVMGDTGGTGPQGKMGRFYYYAGEFNQNDSTQTFIVNDAQAPYFSHGINNATNLPNCHVFNPDTGGTFTMSQMWTAGNGSFDNSPWVPFTNNFEYLMSRAVFTDFAKLGSAVFNKDWLISQYGQRYTVLGSSQKSVSSESWSLISNSTSSTYLEEGQVITVYISAYRNSSGSVLNIRPFICNAATFSLSNGQISEARIAITSTAVNTYEFTVRAEKTGYLFFVGHSYGTVTSIYTYFSSQYQLAMPSFINRDAVILLDDVSQMEVQPDSYNNSSSGNITAVKQVTNRTFEIPGKQKFTLSLNIRSNTISSGTLYIGLIYYNGTNYTSLGAVGISSSSGTGEKTATITKTTTGTVTAFVAGWWVGASSSNKVVFNKVSLTPNDSGTEENQSFVPMIAMDWQSGYAHFAGGNARFNPNGDVYVKGDIHATSGVFSGLLKKTPTIVTSANVSNYTVSNIFGDDVLDFEKVGTYIVFSDLTVDVSMYFRGLFGYYPNYTDEQKEYVRSLVGNQVLIYNKSSRSINISGHTVNKNGSNVSYSITRNYLCSLECKIKGYEYDSIYPDRENYEDIYWECMIMRID